VAQNILSKDVLALRRGVRLPLHASFDSLMETGRTSCFGAYNLQNPRRKRGVRECIVPREGHVIVGCDYDKAELHTLAQVCLRVLGQSRLAEALNEGLDPHVLMAAQMLGSTYEDVSTALAGSGEARALAKEARQRAKPANFGFPGGMGPRGFVAFSRNMYGIHFDALAAERIYDDYLSTWPEMPKYFNWIRNLCGEAEAATIVQFGSHRRRGLVGYCAAANGFFQGLAADMAGAAIWAVAHAQHAEPDSALYGTHTINFVHDELLVEAPEEVGHEVAHELQRVMIEAARPWVPDVPVRASPVIMRRWSKDAEQVWAGDRLVAWDWEGP
jgi:DNA polymerase-1